MAASGDILDDAVVRLIGRPQYATETGIAANALSVRAMCAAVENGDLAYWSENGDDAGICPATMLATWGRPELWEPGGTEPLRALQAHFDLKALLDYPASVAVSNSLIFYAPVRIGDRLHTQQVIRSIGEVKQTKLGRGRFWTVEMQYLDAGGALVGVERYEFFGFRKADGA